MCACRGRVLTTRPRYRPSSIITSLRTRHPQGTNSASDRPSTALTLCPSLPGTQVSLVVHNALHAVDGASTVFEGLAGVISLSGADERHAALSFVIASLPPRRRRVHARCHRPIRCARCPKDTRTPRHRTNACGRARPRREHPESACPHPRRSGGRGMLPDERCPRTACAGAAAPRSSAIVHRPRGLLQCVTRRRVRVSSGDRPRSVSGGQVRLCGGDGGGESAADELRFFVRDDDRDGAGGRDAPRVGRQRQ